MRIFLALFIGLPLIGWFIGKLLGDFSSKISKTPVLTGSEKPTKQVFIDNSSHTHFHVHASDKNTEITALSDKVNNLSNDDIDITYD